MTIQDIKRKQISVRGDRYAILEARAKKLAKERGLADIKVSEYLIETSEFFENNRMRKNELG